MTPQLEVQKRISWEDVERAACTPNVIALVFDALADAGFAVVPVELSEKQFRAVDAAVHDHWPNARKMAASVWSAMIRAAQEQDR